MNDPRYALTAENVYKVTPDVLKADERIDALVQALAQLFARRTGEIDSITLYPKIDGIPEPLLDILARDFKVDWYNYNYSVETKRETFRSSFYIHRILGTPEAVNMMLSAVFPGSYIEEWFQYGGEPHHFQVVIETKAAREPANADDIMWAVQLVKRLSSHLDGIVYQCDMSIIVETHEDVFRSTAEWPGKKQHCGVKPERSTHGGFASDAIQIQTSSTGYVYTTPLSGTVNGRTVKGDSQSVRSTVETGTAVFKPVSQTAGQTDEIRKEKTQGVPIPGGLYAKVMGVGYPYNSPVCGTRVCGRSARL